MKLLHCLPLIICLSCTEAIEITPKEELGVLPDNENALEELLSTDIDDIDRLEVYAKLGKLLKDIDPKKAQQYFDDQLTLAKDIGNMEFEGRAYHGMGLILRREEKYVEAVNSYLHAVDIFYEAQLFQRLADDLNNIGYVFLQVDAFDEAIEYFDKAQKFYAESKDFKYQVIALLNLGLCYAKKKVPDFDEAKEYYYKAISVQQEFDPNDHFQLSQAYNLLGSLSFDQHNYNAAINYYKKSIEYANKIGNANSLLVNGYHNLAETYMNLGGDFYKDAHAWIEKAGDLANSEAATSNVSVRRLNIAGELKQRQGKHLEAIRIFEQAIDVADQENHNEPLRNTLNLINKSQMAVVRDGGKVDFEKIFAVEELEDKLERHKTELDDSLEKQALKEALNKEVVAYQAQVKQASIDRDRWVIIKAVIVAFILLSSALVVVYIIARQRKKALLIHEGEREVIAQILRNNRF